MFGSDFGETGGVDRECVKKALQEDRRRVMPSKEKRFTLISSALDDLRCEDFDVLKS